MGVNGLMAPPSFLTNPDEATKIAQLLRDCSEIPKPLTLFELLGKAKSSITQMLKNGHTYKDVVRVLASFEVMTSESEVEGCHTQVNQLKGKRGKRKRKDNHSNPEPEFLIDFAIAQQICQDLAQQAEIRKGLTKEELVAQLREPIEQMLASGYSYEDIAQQMSVGGVQIAPSTLKTYYNKLERNQAPFSASQSQNLDALTDTSSLNSDSFSTQLKTDGERVQSSVKDKQGGHSRTFEETSHTVAQEKSKNSKRLRETVIVSENELEKEFNL